jgi:ribosome biogenesis GTPase
MENIGLSQRFLNESTLYEGLYIGRITSQYKGLYKVITEDGILSAEVSGKFRYEAKTASDYPAVGDFVMIDRNDGKDGNAIIHHVLTRKSAFIRNAAGTSNEEQIVAPIHPPVNASTNIIFNVCFLLSPMERLIAI